jgi:hypothetical protein
MLHWKQFKCMKIGRQEEGRKTERKEGREEGRERGRKGGRGGRGWIGLLNLQCEGKHSYHYG